MTDIVDKLRHHKAGRFELGVNEALMDQAADEIERLRAYETIFTKYHERFTSGCACNVAEDDDGSAAFAENGERIARWCGLHQWYMDQRVTDQGG